MALLCGLSWDASDGRTRGEEIISFSESQTPVRACLNAGAGARLV